MLNFRFAPIKALLISTLATVPAACSISGGAPVNFRELGSVVADLPGVQGKTVEDQRRIDRTVAKSCASGILGNGQCDLHTRASAGRRAELKQNDG